MILVLTAIGIFSLAPLRVAVPVALALAALAVATAYATRRALRLPVKAGNESLVGGVGTVVEWNGGAGLIRYRGELWRATGDGPFRPEERVRVERVEGTWLHVRPEKRSRAVTSPCRTP